MRKPALNTAVAIATLGFGASPSHAAAIEEIVVAGNRSDIL